MPDTVRRLARQFGARVRCFFAGGHRWVTTITGLEPRGDGWTVTGSTTACHRCGTPRD